MPFLSVIIPVGKVDDALRGCLQSLARQTLPREDFEIVLVLDGVSLPNEFLPRLDASPVIRICTIERPSGRSVARNRGLEQARGPIAVSLDCDMVTCPELLARHFDAHQRGSVACLGVRKFVYPYDGMSPLTEEGFNSMLSACYAREDYRERFYRATNYLENAAEPFWAFSTCNCSYPVEIAREVGLFDEQMRAWGLADVEFGYRLWRTGDLNFLYLPRAVAIHVEHPRDKAADLRSREANRAYCVAKHGDLFADRPGRRMPPALKSAR